MGKWGCNEDFECIPLSGKRGADITSSGRPLAVDREFVYIEWRVRFLAERSKNFCPARAWPFLAARLGRAFPMRFANMIRVRPQPGGPEDWGLRLKTLVFLRFSLGFAICACPSWNQFRRAADAFCMRIPSNRSKSVPSQWLRKTRL